MDAGAEQENGARLVAMLGMLTPQLLMRVDAYLADWTAHQRIIGGGHNQEAWHSHLAQPS